jgi:beta-lactamase class A
VGIYFRDLNNGPAFGINESEPFIPASLMKVPIMMAWFAASEEEPELLDKNIVFTKKYSLATPGVQHIPPQEEIVPGMTYTARELIRRSIVYSDNQAVTRLIEELPPRHVRDLFAILDIPDGVLNGPDGRLSVKEYASFFRVLFNSSYLDRNLSESALKLLSETQFNRGLVAGVPTGVLVAHKFGEAGDESVHQIHDCGIVYYPGHPYLICVMTRGSDINKLESAVADIARFVYERIDAQYKVTK